MPRTVMPLEEFRIWSAVEPRFADTLKAQTAAMMDLNLMLVARDFETTSVTVIPRMGTTLDCYTTPDAPFTLRPLETPDREFKAWRQFESGEWVLEPAWNVQIVRDPSGRARGAMERGCRAFCIVRTYVAEQLHPNPFSQPVATELA